MEKQNKYTELKGKIKSLIDAEEVNDKRKELLEKIIVLMELDKLVKLSELAISESDTAKLLEIVKQNIEGYKINLDNLIDGEHKIIYISEYVEIKEKINKLSELESELERQCNSQYQPYIDKYEELLASYYDLLLGNSATNLFDELSKHEINDVYEGLESNKFYVDLKRCINFEREKKKNAKVVELCDDILSYRNVLRENLDKLVEYNKLSSEITSSMGIKTIEELKILKEKQINCNRRLLSAGLSNLLLGLNTNLKLALSRSNTPLQMYLQDVRDNDDLNLYFGEVKDVRDRITNYMERSFIFEEKYLMNTADPLALEIVNDDVVNARTLLSLADAKGEPTIETMLLEFLLAMNNTNIQDMNVDEKEFLNIRKHFNKKMNIRNQEFFDRYMEIVENKEKNKEKTK